MLALTGTAALCGQLSTIDREAHYSEGPMWHNGKLLYVEYSANNIKAWDGKGTTVPFETRILAPFKRRRRNPSNTSL